MSKQKKDVVASTRFPPGEPAAARMDAPDAAPSAERATRTEKTGLAVIARMMTREQRTTRLLLGIVQDQVQAQHAAAQAQAAQTATLLHAFMESRRDLLETMRALKGLQPAAPPVPADPLSFARGVLDLVREIQGLSVDRGGARVAAATKGDLLSEKPSTPLATMSRADTPDAEAKPALALTPTTPVMPVPDGGELPPSTARSVAASALLGAEEPAPVPRVAPVDSGSVQHATRLTPADVSSLPTTINPALKAEEAGLDVQVMRAVDVLYLGVSSPGAEAPRTAEILSSEAGYGGIMPTLASVQVPVDGVGDNALLRAHESLGSLDTAPALALAECMRAPSSEGARTNERVSATATVEASRIVARSSAREASPADLVPPPQAEIQRAEEAEVSRIVPSRSAPSLATEQWPATASPPAGHAERALPPLEVGGDGSPAAEVPLGSLASAPATTPVESLPAQASQGMNGHAEVPLMAAGEVDGAPRLVAEVPHVAAPSPAPDASWVDHPPSPQAETPPAVGGSAQGVSIERAEGVAAIDVPGLSSSAVEKTNETQTVDEGLRRLASIPAILLSEHMPAWSTAGGDMQAEETCPGCADSPAPESDVEATPLAVGADEVPATAPEVSRIPVPTPPVSAPAEAVEAQRVEEVPTIVPQRPAPLPSVRPRGETAAVPHVVPGDDPGASSLRTWVDGILRNQETKRDSALPPPQKRECAGDISTVDVVAGEHPELDASGFGPKGSAMLRVLMDMVLAQQAQRNPDCAPQVTGFSEAQVAAAGKIIRSVPEYHAWFLRMEVEEEVPPLPWVVSPGRCAPEARAGVHGASGT